LRGQIRIYFPVFRRITLNSDKAKHPSPPLTSPKSNTANIIVDEAVKQTKTKTTMQNKPYFEERGLYASSLLFSPPIAV